MGRAQFYGGLFGKPLQQPQAGPWYTCADLAGPLGAWAQQTLLIYWPAMPTDLSGIPLLQVVCDLDATSLTPGSTTQNIQLQLQVLGTPSSTWTGNASMAQGSRTGYWNSETLLVQGAQGAQVHPINYVFEPPHTAFSDPTNRTLTSPRQWQILVNCQSNGAGAAGWVRNIKGRVLYSPLTA